MEEERNRTIQFITLIFYITNNCHFTVKNIFSKNYKNVLTFSEDILGEKPVMDITIEGKKDDVEYIVCLILREHPNWFYEVEY